MAIVMNGTTIPTKKGNIKFNGTEITEVICNGTSVWKVVSDPIYIVKDGVLQDTIAPNPSYQAPGHSLSYGNWLLSATDPLWGVGGHTNGSTVSVWYAKTGSINTEGASTLDISVRVACDGDAYAKNIRTIVKSGSTEIFSKNEVYDVVTNYSCLFWDRFSYSVDISKYSTIEIIIESNSTSSSNAWIRIGVESAVMK